MILFRELGTQHYDTTYQQMKQFLDARQHTECPDEIWLLEHHPVITIGSSGNMNDILIQKDIPVIHTDRGGQVTYHGPGQLIGYFNIDLRRRAIKTSAFIKKVEEVLCDTLHNFDIKCETQAQHPGIYVDGNKIASFGFKIDKGFTYHGFSLNVCMDLKPFSTIHPCGLKNISMVNMNDYTNTVTMQKVITTCRSILSTQFSS